MMESHPLFAGVRLQALAAYRSVFTVRDVRRCALIFDQGDDASAVFLVLRGGFALTRVAPCGREIAPELLGPGSVVGADALCAGGGRRPARATAITDSTCVSVATADLTRILTHDGNIAFNLVRILCLQHEAMVATLEELATLNVVERIARFLSRLAAPSDGPVSDTVRVGLPLTHAQIAAFVSSSRETVSLEIGRLVRAGRVVRDGDGYAVRRQPDDAFTHATTWRSI
jgi:CRP/FNR family transcriptional regulator